ncbi:unnamed protein product [Closterium sp. NIES-53]
MIRKEVFVSEAVMRECKRIIAESEGFLLFGAGSEVSSFLVNRSSFQDQANLAVRHFIISRFFLYAKLVFVGLTSLLAELSPAPGLH